MKREVYLDGNAGMPLRPEAREALLRALDALPGNPSSSHAAGRRARALVSDARDAVAALIGAAPREVVFTSGATESNVLALRGALAAAATGRDGVVVSRAEHPSLQRLCDGLTSTGRSVVRTPVDADGRASADVYAQCIDARTAVASLVCADSVTGTLQPVAAVASAAHTAGAVFHTDAAQAAGRVPLDVHAIGADLASLSAQKLGGPPGVGALYVREGAAWSAPDLRGTQELGRRAGTEAVPLIAAFGAAARAAAADTDSFSRRAAGQLAPLAEFVRAFPGGRVLTPTAGALTNTLLIAFDGCPGDAVLAALDAHGVRVSTGTACTSLARTPADVLLAAGMTLIDAARAVRVSTSWNTTADDVRALIAELGAALPRVRAALATS